MICPTCKTPNEAGARYCNSCGATLSSLSASAEAETAAMTSEVTAEARKSTSDPLIGQIIDGRYRIDKLIGRGGMGTVYRANRLLIGDEVAIKILHTGHAVDSHAAERFRREARAAARLKHPNAVSIYDFGVSSGGLQYLVMDLVEGKSLREFIKMEGPLTISLTTEITLQVCAALDEAHRQHIVHRDIKPDNIILDFTPGRLRVKVLDFGIAKLRDDTASHLTQTGSVMGTPHYMSPEQCLGEELDSRADVYSMGIVLYEMLCGRVPFNSPISTAVVVQHVNQPPPSLRAINPAVPPEVEAVVFRALEKRREARPASAAALSHELASVARSAEVVSSRSIPGLSVVASPKPNGMVEEETIERKIRIQSGVAQSMPKTIHMASPRIGVPAIGRNTQGNSATDTVRLKSPFRAKYLAIGVPIISVAVLIGLIAWFFSAGKNEDTPVEQVNATQQNTEPVGQSPKPNEVGKAIKLAAPAGMVPVDGERFRMGSNDRDPDSKPPHMVMVKPFFIDIHEVMCQEYKEFVDKTGHAAPKTWVNGSFPAGTARHPVTNVSWEDAAAYAQWVGKRLPTEQEWEFAARGKGGFRYPWGNAWKPGCANADEEGAARKGLANVGSHDCASPFGAKDLIGNAWEWTASDWIPYPGGRLANPTSGGEKVIRGGSWESPRSYATSVYRSGFKGPGDQTGFRCAKDTP